MTARKVVLDALTVLSVLAAVTVSGMVVAREFFPRTASAGTPVPGTPRRHFTDPGLLHQLGSTAWVPSRPRRGRTVSIVEFADFQCPACRAMEPGLRQVLDEQADSVSFAYHHHPLEGIHPRAFDAAIAYECASDQGRARQMHDILYDRQDELPREPWKELATLAGVPDPARYSACLRSDGAAARVRADAALARDLDLLGTPTLVIGRTEIFGAIGPDSLRALLRRERGR